MTKEEILDENSYDVHFYGGGRKHVLAAMDEYAKITAIEFAEYIGTIMNGESKIVFPNGTTSFDQLYTLFLQSKQPTP